MTVDATVLSAITHPLPTKSILVDQQFISGLDLADPTYGCPGNIDILLSANVFAALTMPFVHKDTSAATIAMQTKLGWVLFGEALANSIQDKRACFDTTSEDRVAAALQDFWRLEEVANSSTFSPDDIQCEKMYAEKHSQIPNGRYCVELPFKEDPPILGASRDRAINGSLQVERKLVANPQLYKDYADCINEFIQHGHMLRIGNPVEYESQVLLPNGKTTYKSYYVPHHAVIKSDSTTTKLRVVFDASSKTTNGNC